MNDQLSPASASSPTREPTGEDTRAENPGPLAMAPIADEEVNNRIEKDGISFIFESRSVSSVIRFIYTPIDGTFADIELEINRADPILPADGGGITIEMGGKEWPADSEEIERHFVSCEQVGEWVEARWQWKCDEELADFLFRFTIQGKSLIVEMEGGHGKATGLDLGRVTGSLHPRLISVPYFTLGDGAPHLLCTAGVFISSLLDWNTSQASRLMAPDTPEACRQTRLNSGCSYAPRTDGRRNPLRERWVLTISRQFEEALPALPQTTPAICDELKNLVWYNLPTIPPSEESYVEIYEQLRLFRQWGMQNVLLNHPDEVWHDGDGNSTLTSTGAPEKGGDDALEEYLEALKELGFSFSLATDYWGIAAINPRWSLEMAALLSDGEPAQANPGQYRLKPGLAATLAPEHARTISEKFHPPVLYVNHHAHLPPWSFIDFDSQVDQAGNLQETTRLQRQILKSQVVAQPGPVIGEGGSHWLYPGLLNGYLARQQGAEPFRKPLLVDFALRYLHPQQIDAGLGTIEQFYGDELENAEKHSRSDHLDRFLSQTVALGHAAVLPDPQTWGLTAAVKTYYLLGQLQTCYLGVPVATIRYHHEGNLLEVTEALVSGAYEHSQVEVTYENGLQIWANGGWEIDWTVQLDDSSYRLPPGSFLAHMPDGPLVYSADTGSGRIDVARCDQYQYCDTRGNLLEIGPLKLDGAALVLQKKWEVDVLPMECQGEIEVNLSHFWSDRRLPPLRVLAFRSDDEDPENFKASMTNQRIRFQPTEDFHRYRITLPEWMVEPGR